MMCAIMAVKANCRYRLVVRARIRASPSWRAVPSAAKACPCGSDRCTVMVSFISCRHPSLEYGLQSTDKVGRHFGKIGECLPANSLTIPL